MALRIRTWPDNVLRYTCQEATLEEALAVIPDMVALANEMDLLGLAANQVGIAKRFFIWRRRTGVGNTQYFDVAINPRVILESPERVSAQEGCASLPGVSVTVARPKTIHVKYTDVMGEIVQEELTWPESAIFMHEYEHLDGFLVVDKLPHELRQRALKLFLQEQRKRRVTNVPGKV